MTESAGRERYSGVPRYNAKGLYRLSDRFIAELYQLLEGREPEASADVLRYRLYKRLGYDGVRQVVSDYLLCLSVEETARNLHTDTAHGGSP